MRYEAGAKVVGSWQRRGRIEIIADILTAALEGARGTPIMYKANLNFAQRKKYLSELLNTGLIGVKVKSPLVYLTTEKGHEWLRNYRQLYMELG